MCTCLHNMSVYPQLWHGHRRKVRTLDVVPVHESSPQKHLGMAHVLKGSQFYLHTHTFIRNQYVPLKNINKNYSETFVRFQYKLHKQM